uniref:Uncharacterized protein n=1 Tax=Dasya naccarioides TaxID=2007180 RepID=A0A1Z1MGN3_9FLOR|nr:hypothetical protein [Dasya naccarioides]ARW65163.1 hypothetical protein [Dasya naccarioides]
MNNYYYLDSFCGQWTTKKSLYLLKNKSEYKYEENFEILKDIEKQINTKLLFKNDRANFLYQLDDNLHIKKFKNNFNETYNVKIFDKNLIKIEKEINYKELIYQEYIYSASENVKISFSLLKKQNQYLFILFTSYIKKINK